MDQETRLWFRTMGRNTKPIFISEAGNGSHTNPVRLLRIAKSAGALPTDPIVSFYERLVRGLEKFLEVNGFNNLFPFPESFCEETERLNKRQREELFDVIRANPMLCGYSLTSWGYANEGVLESGHILKDGIARALQIGWAPLRWSLFTTNRVLYANQPFQLEAVLCNEDTLQPGNYQAEIRIHSDAGVAWRHPFTAKYPLKGYGNMPPLAAKVLDETLSLPAGNYTIHATLHEGGIASGGHLPISVVDVCSQVDESTTVAAWGLSNATKNCLKQHGINVIDFTESSNTEPMLLFIGTPENMDAHWERAMQLASSGGTVVFLNTNPLCGKRTPGTHQMANMPLQIFEEERQYVNPYLTAIAGENARCATFHNWLYHMDTVHITHPVFWNTTDGGILDMELWGDICPEKLFLDMKQPDLVLAAGIGLRVEIENDCATSQAMCVYNKDNGRIIINGLRIEENLGKHPFADQLLLNIVKVYSE